MKNFQAVSAIIGKAWLIDKKYVQSQLPVIVGLLEGNAFVYESKLKSSDTDSEEENSSVCVSAASSTYQVSKYSDFGNAPEGSIAIHTVAGPILKADGDCGEVGSATLAKKFSDAEKSSNIRAHILLIDSPGGQVDGTQTLADIIKSSKKPVVAFVDDGLMASAAYWIGSAADEIISSHKTNYIGSIGVYTTLADYTGYYEQKGIKILEIYAPQSDEKNKDYKDAWEGDESVIKDHLHLIADQFIKSVKSNRKGKINTENHNPFKGGTYDSETALSIGLIDAIGNFEYAVKRADELSTASAPTPTKSNNNANMKIKLLATMTGLLGFFGFSIPAGQASAEFELSEEKLTDLNSKVTEFDSVKSQLAAAIKDKETAEASLTAANATIKENETKISTLEGVIAKFGSMPGATTSAPVKTETDDLGEGKKSIIDPNAEHNKTAAGFGL